MSSLRISAAETSLRRSFGKSMLSCRSQASELGCIILPSTFFSSLAAHTETHDSDMGKARCDADSQHAEMPEAARTAQCRCQALTICQVAVYY